MGVDIQSQRLYITTVKRSNLPGGETCGLNQLGVGCSGCVVGVEGDRELRRRLLEMGFCNGVNVEVVRRAPMGDPIEFKVRGYFLSLRDEQASCIKVQK